MSAPGNGGHQFVNLLGDGLQFGWVAFGEQRVGLMKYLDADGLTGHYDPSTVLILRE